jgi:hypothetical protein
MTSSILKKPGKRQSGAVRDLWYALDFLNRKDFSEPGSPWTHLFRGQKLGPANVKRLKNLQRKVRAEVEAALRVPREAGLRKLADEIEKTKLWRVLNVDPMARSSYRPGSSVLDFGDEMFRVEELFGGDNTPEAGVYHYFDQALRTGKFALLKKCRQCSKFFTSHRRSVFACSPGCNTAFHNTRGQETGYFRTRYEQEKKRKLAVARKLKGNPLDVIMKKSGLTKLALKRAGIVEEQE